MTIANVSQWSTTAALNVDINDISLAEGVTRIPAFNNLIREQMAQLATFFAAPAFTATTMSVSLSDNGAGGGPTFELTRISTTPAANDVLGILQFMGRDSGAASQSYASIRAVILDPTAASEDGRFDIITTVAGTATTAMSVAQGLSMAGASDPGAGRMAATGFNFTTGATILFDTNDVVLTHSTGTLAFTTVSTGAQGPTLEFYHNSSSPAISDATVALRFYGNSSTGVKRQYGIIGTSITDTTNASEDGYLSFWAMSAGTVTNSVNITGVILGIGTDTAFAMGSGSTDGAYIETAGNMNISRNNAVQMGLRRRAGDGVAINFHRDTTNVGNISVTTTATAFNTSSDERLKKFIGLYDPMKAIDIIRRDPVRDFNWIEERGGEYAIGWGAQTSYEVSPALASPPDFEWEDWGVDQGKRTPYLWAAVANILDRLDAANL